MSPSEFKPEYKIPTSQDLEPWVQSQLLWFEACAELNRDQLITEGRAGHIGSFIKWLAGGLTNMVTTQEWRLNRAAAKGNIYANQYLYALEAQKLSKPLE